MSYFSRLWIVIVFSSLLLLTSVAQAEESFSPLVEDTIKILDNKLVYKNKSVPIPITRKKLIEVFGKPSREIYNTAGTMVIWDDLGLTCYGCQDKSETPEEFQYMSKEEKQQVKPVETIDSVTLYVRKYNPYPELEKKYAHQPRYPFNGQIVLDDVTLDGRVSFEYFLEKRKSNFTIILPENTFSFFIRCQPVPHEVTLHSIRDRYNDDYLSVFAVSIRNVAQYYTRLPCVDVFNLDETPEAVEKIKQERLDEEAPNNFDKMDTEKKAVPPVKPETPGSSRPTPVLDAPKPVAEPGT